MPFKIQGHCSVLLQENKIMTIGGYREIIGYKSQLVFETYILNLDTQQWSSGPKLNTRRFGHGCGKVKIGNNTFIFVTGGLADQSSIVEFLNTNNINGNWKIGKYFHF